MASNDSDTNCGTIILFVSAHNQLILAYNCTIDTTLKKEEFHNEDELLYHLDRWTSPD